MGTADAIPNVFTYTCTAGALKNKFLQLMDAIAPQNTGRL
jgi:hypothetical protein